MSNVIDFLEQMGQDANLRYATADRVAGALIDAGINSDERSSLLNDQDPGRLENLLGARSNMFCGISPAACGDGDEPTAPERAVSR